MLAASVLLLSLFPAQPPAAAPKAAPLPVPSEWARKRPPVVTHVEGDDIRWSDIVIPPAAPSAPPRPADTAPPKRTSPEAAELRAKVDALTNKADKPGKELGAGSYDPRPAVITQVLLARTVAAMKGRQLPDEMEKKLTGWERKVDPTVRAVNRVVAAKRVDWLTALKTLDGSGETPDLLTLREAAEFATELNAFCLELHAFAHSK